MILFFLAGTRADGVLLLAVVGSILFSEFDNHRRRLLVLFVVHFGAGAAHVIVLGVSRVTCDGNFYTFRRDFSSSSSISRRCCW